MWKTWKIYKILQTWHFLSEGIVMLGVMQESYDVGEDLMFFFLEMHERGWKSWTFCVDDFAQVFPRPA
jgi:hypothetical protein